MKTKEIHTPPTSDEVLRTALARLEAQRATPPQGMTERFMERVVAASEPVASPRRGRLRLWLSSAAAVAAVVALTVLLVPAPSAEEARPVLAQAPSPVRVSSKPVAAPVPPAAQPQPARAVRKASVAARPAVVQEVAGSLLAMEIVAPTSEPTAPAAEEEAVADNAETAAAPQPVAAAAPLAFTPQELQLVERAEQMHEQTTLYIAELVQSALVTEQQRSNPVLQVRRKEPIITRNS